MIVSSEPMVKKKLAKSKHYFQHPEEFGRAEG
jgi:hypothetical protein